MESFKIENLTFCYPNRECEALSDINLTVKKGELITLCGKSGCGKTTLLRLLKPSLKPHGNLSGNIYFEGKDLSELDRRSESGKIGFVLQNPDNQIVCDKVWHEMAFGLESLGFSTADIRKRVAEMAAFFGIEEWFHKKVTELSGGQKQLLNLASVMVMQPSALILDEPTSQLDPIAAQEFLKTLEKINRETGITVIMSEHRLEEAFPISDRVVVMDGGRIIADERPKAIGEILNKMNHDMCLALPAPMRIYSAIEGSDSNAPLTVREGRIWLEEFVKTHKADESLIGREAARLETDTVIELKDVCFRYEKEAQDVVKNLNIKVQRGELFAVVGGNGAGKSTLLSVMSGLNKPYRGKTLINGREITKTEKLYDGVLGVLPQNPQSLFVKKTVFLDLSEAFSETKIPKEEKESRVREIAALCKIEKLLESHPYDLSGGEQQRAALAKVLLKNPEILLLDEPTKGMDAHFKRTFAEILLNLKESGRTVVMVSHDIEFCAELMDRCAMLFDGGITAEGSPREFFAGNSFYTTSANRMSRGVFSDAVLTKDVIRACGGVYEDDIVREKNTEKLPERSAPLKAEKPKNRDRRLTPKKILFGCIFAALFILTWHRGKGYTDWRSQLVQIITIFEMFGCLACFLPGKRTDKAETAEGVKRLNKRTALASLFVLLAVPLTIFIGYYYLEDKKYYFISLLIILETIVPFLTVFESKKPQARELIVISVLAAIAISGRMVFYMLPQFKPLIAVVIVAGVCFGGETGFLVGVVSGFVSNFYFGQSPLTPWQMFGFGIIGFLAGVLVKKGWIGKSRLSLCIFGGLATFFIYGGILNGASLIIWQPDPTLDMVISSYLMGIPFDLIHAVSTSFFLWFISEPMIEKLERVKLKYGIIGK